MVPTYRVIVLSRAFADLDQIIDYIAERSPQNAAATIDHLWKAMQSLDQLPHRFKVHEHRRDPGKTVRSMPVKPYLVYYRVDDQMKVVRVLSVWHGSRRQPRRFR